MLEYFKRRKSAIRFVYNFHKMAFFFFTEKIGGAFSLYHVDYVHISVAESIFAVDRGKVEP